MSFFQKPSRDAATEGRLLARPTKQTETAPKGLQPLGLDDDRSNGGAEGDRDGLLYVPKGYQANQPAPLVLMMHGAGGNASNRRIVPQLQQAGYELRYREFNGFHTVPGAIAREALDWFVAK